MKPLPDNFYEKIKPRLHRRIGRELRLAAAVVDLGCGSCNLVEYLAETYRQKVLGIDISAGSFPRRRHTHAGVRFRCIAKDATHIDFLADQSIDAVVTMWALHEMKHPKAILAEANRIPRPGGEMLVVDFPRGSLAQRLWNESYYSPPEMERIMRQAGLAEIRAKTIERTQVIWATGHRPTPNGPGQ